MSVIGIDLGTASSTVAVIRSGGIDIVVNEVSNRRTPSVVGFTDKKRIIGEEGFTQRQRNVKNTISGPKRLLARKFKDQTLQNELPRLGGCTWLELPNGSVGAEVSLRSSRQAFSSQQITAMLLSHLKETSEKYTKTKAASAVISVPGYYSDAQRRAVLDSAKIAGVSCLQVINDLTAAALLYGFYREVENMNSKVMFIDVGAADTSVQIAHFTFGQCQVLSYTYDPHLGGFDMDQILAEYFAARFKDKTGLDIKTNQRAWQRVMDSVERVKKSLNENDQAGISIECILEDRDLNDRVTRTEYLQLLTSSGIPSRLAACIGTALNDAGLQANELESIEWLGSAMRSVPLQESAAKILGRPLSSTMNAEESVAKGCSLACALVSPLIRLNKKYKLIDIQPTPVSLSWKDPNDPKESSIDLFPKKQHFGKTKYVTITRKEAKPFELAVRYASPSDVLLPDISNGIIALGRVKYIPKDEDAANRDAEVRIKITLENSGTTQIVDVELVEKKEVEVEVPVEKTESTPAPAASPAATPTDQQQTAEDKDKDKEMKDAEQARDPTPTVDMKDVEPPKPEVRKEKRIKTFYTKCPHEISYVEFTPAEITAALQLEQKLRQDDDYAVACLDAKNRLESNIFNARDKLENSWKNYAQQNEPKAILELTVVIEDWLYNEGSDEVKEEYDKRIAQLKALTDPIENRILEERRQKEKAEKEAREAVEKAEKEAREAKEAAEKAEKEAKEAAEKAEKEKNPESNLPL